jgi:PAS domain S-box-containing protein
MSDSMNLNVEQREELEALRNRLMELEELEVMRVNEELERFDSLQVLDEYAKDIEESRDKLSRLFRAAAAVQKAANVQEVLQKVAESIGEAGWGSVTVTLFDNWEVVESAYFGCSEADIEYLETHRRPPAERARFYSPEFDVFKVSRSYYIPAEKVNEVIAQNGIVPGRRPVQCGDTWDPMDLCYVPLYDASGHVLGAINCDDPLDGKAPTKETFSYLEMFADLAARKVEATLFLEQKFVAENALRQSEEMYRSIFDRSSDGYFLMDELFRECNDKACELWVCNREDIVGHSPWEFSPEYQPDGRTSQEAALDYIHRTMEGDPQTFYWQHKRKDGQLMDCEVSLASVERNGESLILAIVRDIGLRVRTDRERETMLNVLQIGSLPIPSDVMISRIMKELLTLVAVENYFIAIHEPRTDYIHFTHFVDEKDQRPPAVPMGRGLTAWVIQHGQPKRLNSAGFLDLLSTGEIELRGTPAKSWLGVPLIGHERTIGALVVQSYHKDNLYSEYHERALSAVARLMAREIERRQTEDRFKFTQFTVDHCADAVLWFDETGNISYANDEACSVLGRCYEDLISSTMCEIDRACDSVPWSQRWQQLKDHKSVTYETEFFAQDGTVIPVEVMAYYVPQESSGIACAYARDIRKRKIEEHNLIRRSEGLRWFVESLDESVCFVDPQENIVYANRAMCRLLGFEEGELDHHNLSEFMDESEFEKVRHQTQLRYEGQSTRYANTMRHRNGQRLSIEVTATPQFDSNGNLQCVLAACKEIKAQES